MNNFSPVESIDPAKTALTVVDTQRYFVTRDSSYGRFVSTTPSEKKCAPSSTESSAPSAYRPAWKTRGFPCSSRRSWSRATTSRRKRG